MACVCGHTEEEHNPVTGTCEFEPEEGEEACKCACYEEEEKEDEAEAK